MEKFFVFKEELGLSRFIMGFNKKEGCYYRFIDGESPKLKTWIEVLKKLVAEEGCLNVSQNKYAILGNPGVEIRYELRLQNTKTKEYVEIPIIIDGTQVIDLEISLPTEVTLKLCNT